MTSTGATVTVAAAVSVPHCVPYMLVNSLMPTGAVFTAERRKRQREQKFIPRHHARKQGSPRRGLG